MPQRTRPRNYRRRQEESDDEEEREGVGQGEATGEEARSEEDSVRCDHTQTE